MALDDIWDYIADGFDYLIHFEWVGDAKDGIVDTFSNINEFSKYGFFFGLIGVLVLLFTQKWMLGSFTKYMKPASALIVTILTYVFTFAAGYFLGKRFEDNG